MKDYSAVRPKPVTRHDAAKVAQRLIDRMGIVWTEHQRQDLTWAIEGLLWSRWDGSVLRRLEEQTADE